MVNAENTGCKSPTLEDCYVVCEVDQDPAGDTSRS